MSRSRRRRCILGNARAALHGNVYVSDLPEDAFPFFLIGASLDVHSRREAMIRMATMMTVSDDDGPHLGDAVIIR